jgi:hypothetical protein
MTTIELCSQTTDTSIELYWDDGRLRSRHGAGAAPAVHIPVVEKFVGRLAEKVGSREGALLFESSTATPRLTSSAGSRSVTAAKPAPSVLTCACSPSQGCTSWTEASCRPTRE